MVSTRERTNDGLTGYFIHRDLSRSAQETAISFQRHTIDQHEMIVPYTQSPHTWTLQTVNETLITIRRDCWKLNDKHSWKMWSEICFELIRMKICSLPYHNEIPYRDSQRRHRDVCPWVHKTGNEIFVYNFRILWNCTIVPHQRHHLNIILKIKQWFF